MPAATEIMSRQDDLELMQRIRRRDPDALAEMYKHYGNLVFSMAIRVLQNTALAEEVTQDVFLQIWARPDAWDGQKGQFSSWLLTVTRYRAIDRLRSEHHHMDTQPLLEELPVLGTTDPNHDTMWHDGQAIRKLLAQLPAEQAVVIELAFFQALTHSQIAAQLEMPLGTVKTRLRLGLQKLRYLWENN